MKKLSALLVAVCLLAVCFAGCGSSANVNITEAAAALRDAAAIENPKEMNDDEMSYNMNITLDNVDSYVGFYTGVTGSSGTAVAVKAKNGKADAVKAELETYRSANADFLSNYPEFATAQEQAKNGRVVAKGDVVVLVIAAPGTDYAAVDSAIEAALK